MVDFNFQLAIESDLALVVLDLAVHLVHLDFELALPQQLVFEDIFEGKYGYQSNS